ncbi:GNAT family N-acetyltransferase [Thalassotalea euphylliae]|uniref:N-acetyltransferase n=1 Tax=Thalassotalea euphylliae TaxID=1655234 RepID=A0A3E0UD01_9GAMM|nr:GNAT family protein [Thalassotalea euphylliae]REL34710.1 N-acetyltransferase [Thalassotalea euphylliae]
MTQALLSPHQITEQLALLPLTAEDASPLFTLIQKNRANLAKYLYWVSDVTDVASTERYILERVNSGLPSATWLKILDNQQICGVFGIKYIDADKQLAEVGYWLSSDSQGRGIISQVIRYMTHILAKHKVRYLNIACLEQNAASIRVAEKAGGQLVSVEPKFLKVNGDWQALLTFQIPLKHKHALV